MNILKDRDKMKIEALIGAVIDKSKIPGLSIVVVNENGAEYFNYGFANIKEGDKTTPKTSFEIGSITKSFTALAILMLESRGLLSLEDDVSKFVPRFNLKFIKNGINVAKRLKIKHLLYQTSGLPFYSLNFVVESNKEKALEDLVHSLNDLQCDFEPGEQHQYATVNYDILGYIIEVITKQTYESFIQEQIIEPLGLSSTYLFHEDAQCLAQGYKFFFRRPISYDAPVFRANKGAGYIISDAVDMGKWIQIQLGLSTIKSEFETVIQKSHTPEEFPRSAGRYYYTAGWYVHMKGKRIFHPGNTPSYATMMMMNQQDKVGVCILANLNSKAVDFLGENIMKILQGKNPLTYRPYKLDHLPKLDYIFSYVVCLSISLVVLFALLAFWVGFIPFQNISLIRLLSASFLSSMMMSVCSICLRYKVFTKLSWRQIYVWAPFTLIWGYPVVLLIITIFIFLALN